MTYATLRRTLEVWTANADPEFLSQIDGIIRQAENRIAMLVDLPAYQKQAVLSLAGATVSLPPDFVSVEWVSVPGYGILEQKDSSFLSEAYPNGEVGAPRYFAMQDEKTLLMGPTPDQPYSATLQYFGKWPSIVDLGKNSATASTETFISSRFETGLIHGCLYYCALFRQDSECAANEKQEMLDSLGLIQRFGKGKAVKQAAEESNAASSNGDVQ